MADFARANNVATYDYTIPAGPIVVWTDLVPTSMDVQYRSLHVPTRIQKGQVCDIWRVYVGD